MRLSSWRRTDCHSSLADINLWDSNFCFRAWNWVSSRLSNTVYCVACCLLEAWVTVQAPPALSVPPPPPPPSRYSSTSGRLMASFYIVTALRDRGPAGLRGIACFFSLPLLQVLFSRCLLALLYMIASVHCVTLVRIRIFCTSFTRSRNMKMA